MKCPYCKRDYPDNVDYLEHIQKVHGGFGT